MSTAVKQTVLVDGATGYLGSHLVHSLCKSQFDVRALVHPGARPDDVDFLRSQGANISTADLSVSDSTELASVFSGYQSVVHLIGSVAPKRGERLEDLHVGQTRNLVRACKQAGVSRVIMITSLGARQDANNSYQATKWMAEEEVRKGGMQYIILRPPLLVGRTVGNRDSKLVKRYRQMIITKKVVPLIDGGKNKLQPLFIDDLVEAIRRCLQPECKFSGKELDLGGQDVLTMRQFVEMFMDVLGIQKPIVALHPALANIAASICEATQQVPTISRDQVKLALSDNICTDNALVSLLNIQPVSVRKALESYNTQSAEMAGRNL